MERYLQINTGDGWFNLNRRYDEEATQLYKLQQRWQDNYDPFRQAKFRIVVRRPGRRAIEGELS